MSSAVKTLESQAVQLRSLATELTLAELRERWRLAMVLHAPSFRGLSGGERSRVTEGANPSLYRPLRVAGLRVPLLDEGMLRLLTALNILLTHCKLAVKGFYIS